MGLIDMGTLKSRIKRRLAGVDMTGPEGVRQQREKSRIDVSVEDVGSRATAATQGPKSYLVMIMQDKSK